MDVLLRAARALPWSQLLSFLQSRGVERFAAGGLLGILAACAFSQQLATWGASAPLDRGLSLTLLIGIAAGGVLQRRAAWRWPIWLMISAAIAPVFSWWVDLLGAGVAQLPLSLTQNPNGIEAVGFALSFLSLAVPITCWMACLCALCDAAEEENQSSPWWTVCGGGACGVMACGLMFGPWLGTEMTAIVASALALGVSYFRLSRAGGVSPLVDSKFGGLRPPLGNLVHDRGLSSAVCLVGLFAAGAALSVSRELTQSLMAPALYLQVAFWSVVVAGIGLGSYFSRWAHHRAAVVGLTVLLAALTANIWAFDLGVTYCLWTSSFVIQSFLHQLALVALIAVAVLPLSVGAGLLQTSRRVASLASLIGGYLLFHELSFADSAASLTTMLLLGLSVLTLVAFAATQPWPAFRWPTAAVGTALLCGVAAAWITPPVESARAAKVLFSTQSFLAYRSGWKADLLPHLDDARLIAQRPGRQGALTLWSSRGCDLLLREAGIPRCAIACRPDLSPQNASEVLQTVFPLLVGETTRNVLLLGASGGTPLATFLAFPVEHVTCVEPDAERIALIRGPIAQQRGFDPFTEDRASWDRRPVELAVAMSDGHYDLIASCPPSSVTAAAASQFTREFYRHASRKLSDHGVFCQRWEGIDYGPAPVQMVIKSLQASFREVVAVEIGVGELLFLATNSEQGLVRSDLPERLETPLVRQMLARCGWDWSTLLTLPAWDHSALKEIAQDGSRQANTAGNCRLAFAAPCDVFRWGPKLQDVQTLMTKTRETDPTYSPVVDVAEASEEQGPPSRRARYLDWLGATVVSHDVLRRLSEVAAQSKIVYDNPDSFWLEYRRALREELQQRPRTEIRQVAVTSETERVLHPEDERRKEYFVSLGVASDMKQRNLEAVYDLARYFEPHDPLLSLFARQEMAELLKLYGHPDPALELALRLHVIQFAPSHDRSLRNVLAAADLMLEFEDAIPDPQMQFDTLNGLLQTIRTRWDGRAAAQLKSVKLAIQDTERSLLTVEKIVTLLDRLAASGQVDAAEWPARRDVVERVLLRPLRSYRAELLPLQDENRTKTDAARMEVRKGRKS